MDQEDTKRAAIAAEILALEKLFHEGNLSEQQLSHWRSLTAELVSWLRASAVDNRQMTRFDGSAEVALHGDDDSCDCTLENVSHLGFQLRGSLDSFQPGQRVEVSFQGAAYGTHLSCQLVWKRTDPATREYVVGLHITADNPPEQQERFFRHVYYPIYLRFLHQLAQDGELA